MTTTHDDARTTDAAKDEARHVAGVAADQAQNVAQEAKAQAKGLLDDARTQIDEQSRTQVSHLTDVLEKLGNDLGQMAEASDSDGLAKDLTRAVSDRAQDLRSRIAGREPSDLLEEVRDFARRRPGTFLLGALAAGVVTGRLLRGAKDGQATGAHDAAVTGRAADVPSGVRPAAQPGVPSTVSATPPTGDPSGITDRSAQTIDSAPLSPTELADARQGADPARPWGTHESDSSTSHGGQL
jgi:hypothetical protein